MKRFLGLLSAFIFAWYAASCTKQTQQGVFEAGNPGLRSVQGSVPKEDGVCQADQAVATDSHSAQTEAVIQADCTFRFSLPVEESYSLVFLRDGVLVAKVNFDGSDFFFLENAETPLDLGLIAFDATSTVTGTVSGTGTPEFPPPTEETPPLLPNLPDLFGTYIPGVVSGLTCPENLGLVFPESVFEVVSQEGVEDGLTITQIVPSSLLGDLTQIVMTGSFVSPGYFSVSGLLSGGLQISSCEGLIGLHSDQWQFDATCTLALNNLLKTPLGTCVYSDFLQETP